MIKLLIIDIDGVMTDGTKVYDRDGNVIAKRFHDRDFTAIKRFKKCGMKICFLSGDERVNLPMANDRKIEFWSSVRYPKEVQLSQILSVYGVQLHETAYIGDDFPDYEIMLEIQQHGGRIFCPSDSCADIKRFAQVLDTPGGRGVIAELFDRIGPK